MYNPFKKYDSVTFYMKSGNSFIIDKVMDWKVKYGYESKSITELRVVQHHSAKNYLVLTSIELTQIEAIVRN